MKMNHKMTRYASKVKGKLTTIFDPEPLETLARQSQFIQRSSSKLSGKDFVELMTTELMQEPAVSLEGLCDRLVELNPQAEMTPQALHQRINSYAVTYLQEVFQLALRQQLEPLCERLPLGALAPFGRVLLEDSTQCRLHEQLAETFKGSGGSASPSAVKIDLIYEVLHHSLLELHLSDGTAADQGRALAIIPHLRAGDLVLRDLGYLTLESLRQIEAQEAWYLSRLSKGVDVYLEADAQAPALALVKHLERYYPDDHVIDLPVYLGHERVPSRLLAYRLPEPVVQERRRKALEEARKKGRELSQEYLDWLSFGFYITNVSQQVWPSRVVGTVYRLRWQVELTFRNWKSLLKINVLKGTRPERIKCIIYGRLITIIMLAMISSYASWYAEDHLHRELSLPKLINWLKRKDRLVNAMHDGTLETLLRNLRQALPKLLCKQRRKRRTSRQLMAEYEPYMEDALAA
jgi:hypothetical protein